MENNIMFQKYSKNGFPPPVFGESASPRKSQSDSGMLLAMQLTLAHIGLRPGPKDEFDAITRLYFDRSPPLHAAAPRPSGLKLLCWSGSPGSKGAPPYSPSCSTAAGAR